MWCVPCHKGECTYLCVGVCVSVCVVDGCNSDESYEWVNDALVKSTKKH